MTTETDSRAFEIVKEVAKRFHDFKNKMIEEEGFFYGGIHIDSKSRELINEFEEITGEDWDDAAQSYLDKGLK